MASSSHVRAVIELFCKILSENDVHDSVLGLRAEALRQAKFNNPAASCSIWQLVYNVICYCSGKSTSKNTSFSLTGNKLCFIKSKLQRWGYLDQSVAQLTCQSGTCSRQLLLVLGWVVHKRRLFDLIVSRRSSPLREDLFSFLGVQESEKVTHPRATPQPRGLSNEDQLQFQVLLSGKLRRSLKRLYATQQQSAVLKNKIASSTKGVNIQPELDHLTPLEVYLLKNKQGLKKMMDRIESDSQELQNLIDWKEKEHVFWEWMDSVLNLHIEENSGDPVDSQVSSEDGVFLPVPLTIGQDIMDTRAKLRDLILNHEEDIEHMERLFISKKIPKLELQLMTHVLEREIAQLSHRLLHCGTGIIEPSELNEQDAEEPEPMVKEVTDKARKTTGYWQQGSKEAVKNLHTQTTTKMEKISALQQEVDKLESELQSVQVRSLQRLQTQIAQEPSAICIQPTMLKHFFNS